MKIRFALNKLYQISGALAAISIVAIFVLVLAQIAFRLLNSHIPSSDSISGYFVVWATYFGLAYTMYKSGHIRVELFISKLNHDSKRIMLIILSLIAVIVISILCYYTIILIYESYTFGDKTDGELALPLWLVQLPMGIGCVLFVISLIDNVFITILSSAKSATNATSSATTNATSDLCQ